LEKILAKEKVHADGWINAIRILISTIRNLRTDRKKSTDDKKISKKYIEEK